MIALGQVDYYAALGQVDYKLAYVACECGLGDELPRTVASLKCGSFALPGTHFAMVPDNAIYVQQAPGDPIVISGPVWVREQPRTHRKESTPRGAASREPVPPVTRGIKREYTPFLLVSQGITRHLQGIALPPF